MDTKLMTFQRFLETYVDKDNSQGYLAQHSLFDQIPSLASDAPLPDYAFVGPTHSDVARLVWIGPRGTVSPLHTDPYDNVFAQIVGQKYVRLYSTSEDSRLYPFPELLTNTSQVASDITQGAVVDRERFPLFEGATYLEGVVEAGDILYIPKLWWHFVKSLTRSISISHWLQ